MLFKFNMPYKDKELKRSIKANEEVEMTKKRADEIVKTIHALAEEEEYKDYKAFNYERVEETEEVKEANK